ncbi:hypothetical protein D1007_31751 [Hordeum vulgare]|nr:hypothetical protein D1007_31751 [Hordeum vulgare]
MPLPPARRPRLAPAVKPTKGRGGGKRAANRSRNPTDSSTRPVKLSKAAATARGDESQPLWSAASSGSPTSIPQPPPPPPPAVEDDVATLTAIPSNMFDEMSQSLDDEAFMRATNVANDDYMYASQEYETQYDDDNLDVDDEGFVVKGRSGNYTTAEDVLICTAWKKISQDASVGSMEGDFSGMGGGVGGMGGGVGGNMSGVGVVFVGNMTGMGRNEDASGGAHGNESLLLVENVDKEGIEDDDRTTVQKADGVDDPHE